MDSIVSDSMSVLSPLVEKRSVTTRSWSSRSIGVTPKVQLRTMNNIVSVSLSLSVLLSLAPTFALHQLRVRCQFSQPPA